MALLAGLFSRRDKKAETAAGPTDEAAYSGENPFLRSGLRRQHRRHRGNVDPAAQDKAPVFRLRHARDPPPADSDCLDCGAGDLMLYSFRELLLWFSPGCTMKETDILQYDTGGNEQMSTSIIFCYSGTGNCLDTARNIAKELGDTDIVMMRSFPTLLT